MNKKESLKAIVLLQQLMEFVEFQERHNLIDGACDPTWAYEESKKLVGKYQQENKTSFFMEV